MKLVERNADSLTFEIAQADRELLVFLLRLYPVLDPAFHRISSSSEDDGLKSEQQLLTESMTASQQANRRRVEHFIQSRLTPAGSAGDPTTDLRLTLDWTEADWLLRLVNDVRVGCWVRLGRPDSIHLDSLRISPAEVTDFAAMELGGLVLNTLVDALNG